MKNLSFKDESVKQHDSLHDRISYSSSIHSLTIYYYNYQQEDRGRRDLMRFLEQFAVVDASELGGNEIVYSERVFKFCDLHEEVLLHTGKVTLRYLGRLIDYVSPKEDNDFIQKYYKQKYKNFSGLKKI